MKKRIYVLLTIVLSLFLFSGRVEAAQELSCVYKAGNDNTAKMVVQDAEGNVKIFVSTISGSSYNNPGEYTPEFDSSAWEEIANVELVYNGKHKENNYLTGCPEYSSLLPANSEKITLYDSAPAIQQDERAELASSKFETPWFVKTQRFNGLVCIYGGGKNRAKMLIQQSNGSKYLFFTSSGNTADIDYSDWVRSEKNIKIYDVYDEFLTSCPKYSSDDTYHVTSGDFSLSNVNDPATDLGLLHEYSSSDLPNMVYDQINNSSYANKVEFLQRTRFYNIFDYVNDDFFKNVEWKAKCVYGSTGDTVEFYFNDDTYIINVKRTSVLENFILVETKIEMNELERLNYCPYEIYEGTYKFKDLNGIYEYDTADFFAQYSFYSRKRIYSDLYGYNESELSWIKDETVWYGDIDGDGPNGPIDDCGDLLGEEVLNIINDIMDWIKIIVPILLIVYGIIDFTKVVFSGKDDSMSKAGKTFFNRIIAAVLVFIAPIFINLLLSLANQVWSFINPSTCVNIEESE